MKNRILAVVLLASLLSCGNISAQGYLGGAFSILGARNASVGGELVSSASITVAPNFGWYLGDKWAAGFMPAVGLSLNEGAGSARCGVTPYIRYYLLDIDRLGLWAEGYTDLSYIHSWTKGDTGTNTLSYSIQVVPVLTFDLNEHIMLEAVIDLFSLGYRGYSTHYPTGYWFHSSNFGLAASGEDVISSLSNISVGILYRF